MGEKADELAKQLRLALGSNRVKISRPMRRREVLITNFDESVDQQEVGVETCKDWRMPSHRD